MTAPTAATTMLWTSERMICVLSNSSNVVASTSGSVDVTPVFSSS
jgi:hypothetical protein